MANWPSSLPIPLVENVSYASAENVIKTQMEAGAPKMRRRFTSVPEMATFRLFLSRAQVQVLQDFVRVTLADVLPFQWREFRLPDETFSDGTENTAIYRFVGRPTYVPAISGLWWYADITLEIVSSSLTRALLGEDLEPTTGERVPPIMDLFIVVGQSNAEGRGDSSLSPDATASGLYYDGSTFSALADPVGGASTGSMWPAFANAWYATTGRRACFIEQAKGNSALIAAAETTSSGHWSPTGTLRATAATAANAAIAAIEGSADYTMGTVRFVWAQGERDSESWNGTTVTGPLYEQALEDLATYFKAQVPDMLEMVVIQTGRDPVSPEDPKFAAIREAQENACTDSALLRMVYRGTSSYGWHPVPGDYYSDNLHYSQALLNIVGEAAAYETDSETATTFSPTITATANNYSGTAVGSRTFAHTCQSTTKTLIVSVGVARATNNALTVDSVSFNGAALRQVQKAGSSTGTAPGSLAQASVWILDEEDYGAVLASATGDIVVTLSFAAAVIASVSVLESNIDLLIESQDWLNDSDGTVATIEADAYTNVPALVVTCVAGRVVSSTPPTYTVSGSDTEVADYGYNLDANRSFGVVTAYEVLAAAGYPTTITVTPSATLSHAGIVVAGFRKKVAGETSQP